MTVRRIDVDRTNSLKKLTDQNYFSWSDSSNQDLWALVQSLAYQADGVLDDVWMAYDDVCIYPDQNDLDRYTAFSVDALDAVRTSLGLIRLIAYRKSGDGDTDDYLYGYDSDWD